MRARTAMGAARHPAGHDSGRGRALTPRPHRRPGFTVDPLSYSYRETSGSIWRNRVGTTSLLFTVAMGLSYLLGRPPQ